MKKVFILVLILSIFFTAQAGYVIKGINVVYRPDDLKNYTLTVDSDGPISAAAMYSPSGGGTGRNSIVIIPEDPTLVATCFPITISGGGDERFNLDVKDFHYLSNRQIYVLCGSRETYYNTNAFVAVIDNGFSTMEYYEYDGLDIFYSIWAENSAFSTMDYFVCGRYGRDGVIASISPSNFDITNILITNVIQTWEYHKIIFKANTMGNNRFVVSGRNIAHAWIGFTVLDPSFTSIRSYMWEQRTDPLSLCVVSSDILANDAIILASSYRNIVTLNPVTYPLMIGIQVPAYRFSFSGDYNYSVQDIGTIQSISGVPRISVAGFKRQTLAAPAYSVAWHGYVTGLSTTTVMRNTDYFGIQRDFEHYKIRYQGGNEYTGGYFQSYFQSPNEMGALFGTPLTIAPDCDRRYLSDAPIFDNIPWSPLPLSPHNKSDVYHDICVPNEEEMETTYCLPFKEGDFDLKTMPAETETEITAFPDRITIKDAPANTNYQIYNTIGQLIQTGATNPDISTANLNKGVYILRLENGKTVKFVR